MADLRRIIRNIIAPALAGQPMGFDTPEARVMLLAIGLQESRFETRVQIAPGGGPGPARGFWQFERGGGVHGVLNNPQTRGLALEACALAGVAPADRPVWSLLAADDVFACRFARLLLWSDPAPLPRLGRGGEGWDYYVRNWRPGQPHKSTWNGLYAQALEAVQA